MNPDQEAFGTLPQHWYKAKQHRGKCLTVENNKQRVEVLGLVPKIGAVDEWFSYRPTVPPLTLHCASGSAVHLGIWWTLGAKLTVSLLETLTKSCLRVF